MALTLTFSVARWELQASLLSQLEYLPVFRRWKNEAEQGFLFKFLVFVLRFGAGHR